MNILHPNSILIILYLQSASPVKIFSKVIAFVLQWPHCGFVICYTLHIKVNKSFHSYSEINIISCRVKCFFDYILFSTLPVQWAWCLSDEGISGIKFRWFFSLVSTNLSKSWYILICFTFDIWCFLHGLCLFLIFLNWFCSFIVGRRVSFFA